MAWFVPEDFLHGHVAVDPLIRGGGGLFAVLNNHSIKPCLFEVELENAIRLQNENFYLSGMKPIRDAFI